MYNGQFVKGMVHVVIFAVLVSAAHVYGVFGLFICGLDLLPGVRGLSHGEGAARRRSAARSAGTERGEQLVFDGHAAAARAVQPAAREPRRRESGRESGREPGPGAEQAANQPPYQAPYQAPYQSTYQGPGMPPIPPIPPVPPVHWRRREPIGAVILIALGVLFLLGQLDWFSWRCFEYSGRCCSSGWACG